MDEFNPYDYGKPGVLTDYQGNIGPSLGLSNLYAGTQQGYNLPSDYTGPLLVGYLGDGDPVVLTDPDAIAEYKRAARTRNLQGIAKVGLLVGGAALGGLFGGAGAEAGTGAANAAPWAEAGTGAANAAPWAGELTAAGLPTGAGIAAAPLTGGLGTLGTAAIAAPIGLEEILVTGSRLPTAGLPNLGIEALAATPTLLSMPSNPLSQPEIQGPPEPEYQNFLDKLKDKLPPNLLKYLKNPVITGLIGSLAGKYLSDRNSSERAPQKYPYYQAGGYDWRTGSFAPGKWLDQYPMADGGLVPFARPNYPLGRVQTAGEGGYDALVNPYTGQERPTANFAQGGLASLGTYSDGGQLLRGPGDGVSDTIPAIIEGNQPARLADGEFVIPARIVSEIGNGSTEAGARKLYQIMDAIQRDRKSTVGEGNVAKNTNAERHFLRK